MGVLEDTNGQPVREPAVRAGRDEYGDRYGAGYRSKIRGYEVARWAALEHVLARVLPQEPVRAVLDYGAGSGLYVPMWRARYPLAELHACDPSARAISLLAERYPDLAPHARVMEEGRAPFPTAAYDRVVSVEVMEHVDDLAGYLADVARVLAPGGYFVWTTPCANPGSLEHLCALVTGRIDRTAAGERRFRWEDPTHRRRLTSADAARSCQAAGLSEVGFRFRSHVFGFACGVLRGLLRPIGEQLMRLDYALLRRIPCGASMIGFARKGL